MAGGMDDLRKYRCGLLDAESRLPEIVQTNYADIGITPLMPSGRFCRVGLGYARLSLLSAI
jgi:hypothetical protein